MIFKLLSPYIIEIFLKLLRYEILLQCIIFLDYFLLYVFISFDSVFFTYDALNINYFVVKITRKFIKILKMLYLYML